MLRPHIVVVAFILVVYGNICRRLSLHFKQTHTHTHSHTHERAWAEAEVSSACKVARGRAKEGD